MMLKRLELSGFKSFAKRSVLEFSAPVTAIVGPNGSGKSNVVEAIRFVLGEQSMKSLRGKSGSDLVFKGSKLLPKSSRASAALTFDNTARVFKMTDDEGAVLPLDFDEVTVMREVFSDGTGRYTVQGNEVRLRDIHEMIAHLNIGASGHHIISQGEADRLLHSKPAERKEMLEESLGLRLYHYRIRESERKLMKTDDHLREVESAYRELLPHVKFLKKQVEKIERAAAVADELRTTFTTYQGNMAYFLHTEESRLVSEQGRAQEELRNLVHAMEAERSGASDRALSEHEQNLSQIRNEIRKKQGELDEIGRHLGRIEGMLEVASVAPVPGQKSVPVDEVISFLEELDEYMSDLIVQESSAKTVFAAFREKRDEWLEMHRSAKPAAVSSGSGIDRASLETTRRELEDKRRVLMLSIEELERGAKLHAEEMDVIRQKSRESERSYYETARTRAEREQSVKMIEQSLVELDRMKSLFKEDVREVEALLGSEVIAAPVAGAAIELSRELLDRARHDIERLKIRLEDLGGGGGGGEIMQEYRDADERQRFLEKEIGDLGQAKKDLERIIGDLREKLEKEFQGGVKKVNSAFDEYFKLMFGGGSAKIDSVEISKKQHGTDSEGNETFGDADEVELGIEIDVNLPRKKVKDLDMLSGGERSLTSIALLFALSQVNPPPFLVLDETDAALDEANSRKYGDVLERLSQETQLLVVTHNRETMSRAQILYGVTLGTDDSSTLLSVKFEEAAKVAK